MRRLLSIIVPVYNEEAVIPLLLQRLGPVVEELQKSRDVEVIFMNNASTDGTLEALRDLNLRNPTYQYLTLSRNFGYHRSVLCGLTYARGDGAVVLDCDCEDPPEMILELARHDDKYDVVFGRRDWRPEPAPLQWGRRFFYRLTHRIADNDFVIDMAEFAIISRRVREVAIQTSSTFPFIRNQIAYAGFSRKAVPYRRQHRVAGTSHFRLWPMTLLAIGGIMSASTFPLRLLVYLALPLLVLNLLAAALSLLGIQTAAVGFINFAFVSLSIAVLAAYIARIYKDGLGHALYVVDWAASSLVEESTGRVGHITPGSRAISSQ